MVLRGEIAEKKYDLDESEMAPYLKLENVRDGMFAVANKLYGILKYLFQLNEGLQANIFQTLDHCFHQVKS